jgi:hypothetical protein
MSAKRLTIQQRKDIFLSLVSMQDSGLMSVAESRQAAMKQYSLTEPQLREIEDEGLEKEWLDESLQAG